MLLRLELSPVGHSRDLLGGLPSEKAYWYIGYLEFILNWQLFAVIEICANLNMRGQFYLCSLLLILLFFGELWEITCLTHVLMGIGDFSWRWSRLQWQQIWKVSMQIYTPWKEGQADYWYQNVPFPQLQQVTRVKVPPCQRLKLLASLSCQQTPELSVRNKTSKVYPISSLFFVLPVSCKTFWKL